ncbi:MAG: S8 family peptidase [Bacteroidales bacterium]|nr:S8 family peptidase [Bacteroidales bacterium]
MYTIVFMLCLYQFGLAQQKQRIGQFERVNDSIFIVQEGWRYVANPDVITVKLMPGVSMGELNLNVISSNRLGYMNIAVPHGVDIEDYVSMLDLTGKFEVVEYNTFGEYCGTTMPNDTYIGNQWYLERVNVFSAWDITMGSEDVIVGVIDSGVDWEHDDIGYGSDGYKNIDQSKSWCFAFNNNTTRPSNQHGTQVAGVIGAKTNNSKRVAGISGGNGSSSGVTMISMGMGAGGVDASALGNAIIHAVDSGAKIINMSLSVAKTDAIESAIAYATRNNVLIVAASANHSSSTVRYPASHDDVIAVGATSKNDRRASYSNYGSALNVVAPGDSIYTTSFRFEKWTNPDGSLIYIDSSEYAHHTSLATPIVSGIAALILSVNPNLTGQQVRDIIERTARKVNEYSYANPNGYIYATTPGRPNGTWNEQMGYGLVDAYAAVQAAQGLYGSDTIICQETYTLYVPANCTIIWKVEPEDVFNIIVFDQNSVTIEALSHNGQTGTLTATFCGTTVTKPITTGSLAIFGPDAMSINDFEMAIYQVEGLPPSASAGWTYDNACFSRATFPPGSGSRPLMVAPNPDISIGTCKECLITATVSYNGCEVTLPSKTVHVGYGPDTSLISTMHNLDKVNYAGSAGALLPSICIFSDAITYNGAVPYPSCTKYGILQGQWQAVSPVEVVVPPIQKEPFNPDRIAGIHQDSLRMIALSNGMGHVKVSLANQCGWSKPVYVAYYPDPCNKMLIIYSPNPVNSELTIDFEELPDTDQPEEYTVKLLDNLGNVPRQTRFRHRHRDGKPRPVKFNTYSLPPGTYYLHVEGAGELVREQIIVTR